MKIFKILNNLKLSKQLVDKSKLKETVLEVKDKTDITESLQAEIKKKNSVIVIPQGQYTISETIKVTNHTYIKGADNFLTKLILGDATNGNMFENIDFSLGNNNFCFENLWLEGNSKKQFRPENQKNLSFCNLFYFKNSREINFINIKATDCKQTAMHFNTCENVSINNLQANGMGWSGISTSGTDNIRANGIYIFDSGKDVMHSAVHYDGGIGSYFSGLIEKCTGNGVMLDSKYSVFNKSVIQANCLDCKRGVSLSGSHDNNLTDVLIHNTKTKNCEVGIMVSNSSHVFIEGCDIKTSTQSGVLLQGKKGGCDTVIANTCFKDNKQDISEVHASKDNYFVKNDIKKSIRTSKANVKKEAKSKNRIKKYLDKYEDVCSVCGEKSDFIYFEGSVRESYRCQNCNASLRHRGQAKAILDIYGSGAMSIKELSNKESFKSLVIYEPGIIGPLRKYFNRFPNYSQSYFWDDLPLGEIRDGIQNQNLEELTFKNNSIDLLITADIFEHIRKPWVAFKEVHRVLKSGGKHIFTIPIQYPLPSKTIYRVDTSTDEDIHLLPKHFHIAGDGGKSLVYTDFGGDIIKKLDDTGLKTNYVFIDESNEYRKKNITLVSTKY